MNSVSRCAVIALLSAALCAAQQGPAAGTIVLAGGGYQIPAMSLAVAPGQVIVFHMTGITTAINGNVVATPGPNGLPTVLDGISVDLIQGQAGTVTSLPLTALYQAHCIDPCSPVTGITLQIPFTLESNYGTNNDPAPALRVSENGTPVGAVSLAPVSDNLHVINTCDDSQVNVPAAVSVPADVCAPAVMVGDALNSLYDLAHGGDELAVWLYGLGAITAQAPGCCVTPDQLSKPVESFQLSFDFRPNAPAFPVTPGFGLTAAPLFAAYVGGGQYQINFAVPTVPAGLPACDGVTIKSNLTVTITGLNSYDAAQLCVAP
jgi:hypothetical protein